MGKNADEIAKKYGGSRLSDALKKYGGTPSNVGTTTPPPAPAMGVSDPTRDWNAAQLGDQTVKDLGADLLSPFSLRSGTGQWQIPPLLAPFSPYKPGENGKSGEWQIPPIAKPAVELASQPMAALHGFPATREAVGGLVEGVAGGPVEMAQGLSEGLSGGDFQHLTSGTARTIRDTLPALYGGIKSGTKAYQSIIGSRFPPPSSDIFAQTQHLSTALGIDPESAVASQPFLKATFQKFGLDPAQLPLSENRLLRRSDPYGNLYRGGTPEQLAQVNDRIRIDTQLRNAVGGTPPTRPPVFKSIIPAVANQMVEFANDPFERVMSQFGGVRTPSVQSSIIGDLESALAKNSGPDGIPIDRGLDSAIRARIAEVRSSGDTAGGINNLKAHANKEVGKLSSRAPSAQIAATATPVYSYQLLADAARRHLYPELESMGAPGIREAGIAEHHAILSRDNMLAGWAKAAGQNAPVALQSYLSYFLGGPEMGMKAVASGGTSIPGQMISILGRVGGKTLPLSEFNKHLSLGVGPIDNFKLPSLDINPNALYESKLPGPYERGYKAKGVVAPPAGGVSNAVEFKPPVDPYATSSKGKSVVPKSTPPIPPLIDPVTGRVIPRHQP